MKNSLENRLAGLEKALSSFNHEDPLYENWDYKKWLMEYLRGQIVYHLAPNDEILRSFTAAHLPDLKAEIEALKAKIEKRDKAKERAADPVVSLKNLLKKHKFPKALIDVFVPLFFKSTEEIQKYHIDCIKKGEAGAIRFEDAKKIAQRRGIDNIIDFMNEKCPVNAADGAIRCWYGYLSL